MSHWFRGLALSLAVLMAGLGSVGAQSIQPAGNGFRVSPVRSELTIPQGQSETIIATVENQSDATVRVRPEIHNFVADENESGSPRLILDPNVLPPRNDIKQFIQPLEEFDIPASSSRNISVIISVPNDANAGGYYGAVRFIPLLPDVEGTNVALTATVGSIILLEVPGDLRQQLDLVQLGAAQVDPENPQDATPRGFFIGGNVGVFTRLRNSGDIHVKPFGKVQITNMFGKQIHEYEFNDAPTADERANVLPDTVRKFVDEIPQQSWFGRYTITIHFGYTETGGELISSSSSFWYFSTLAFYSMLIGLLVAIAVIYWLIRRRRSPGRK